MAGAKLLFQPGNRRADIHATDVHHQVDRPAAAGISLPMRELGPRDRKRVLAQVPLGFVAPISQGTPVLQNAL